MNSFGLTPIDCAFTFFGLQVSQQIFQIIFKDTKLGIVFIFIGVLFALIRSIKTTNWRFFILYLLGVCFFVSIFLLTRFFTDIKSYQEITNNEISTTTTDVLILPLDKPIPLILSSIDCFLNNLSFSIIDRINHVFTKELDFIKDPLGIQHLALSNKRILSHGLKNVELNYQLKGFINDEFWPAYILSSGGLLSPDDKTIETKYSRLGLQKWSTIKQDIAKYISNDQQWQKTVSLLNLSQDNPDQSYQDQIRHAIILNIIKPIKYTWVDGVIEHSLMLWPYIIGSINAVVWICFPILALGMLIWPNFDALLFWFKGILWSKLLWIFSCVAYCASLIGARFLQHEPSLASWMWENSFLSCLAFVIIVLTSTVSFILLLRVK